MKNILVSLLAGLLPLYVVRFPVFGIPTNLFEVCVWVVAAVSAGKTLGVNGKTPSVEEALRTIPKRALIFITLFLVSALLSTALSGEIQHSLGILKGWIITPILFGLLVRTAVGKTLGVNGKTPSVEETAIIGSLVLSGLVVALFGLSQIDGFNRIYSVYDVPNSLALFLVPVTVIAGWVGIKNTDKFYKYAGMVMLVAIILTQSLGAVVALVGTMVVAVPLSRSGRGHLPALSGSGVRGVSRDQIPLIRAQHKGWANLLPEREKGARLLRTLVVVIAVAAFFIFSGRLSYLVSPLNNPNTTNSITVRMQLWDIGIDLIKKHPIFGIGLGQFEPAYQEELHHRFAAGRQHQPEFVFRDPHNWIISFWLNMGLLGLVSFIGLNYIALRGFTLSERSESKGEGKSVYQQALALALISMLIFGLFDTIYWKNDLSALWWMLLAYSLPLI